MQNKILLVLWEVLTHGPQTAPILRIPMSFCGGRKSDGGVRCAIIPIICPLSSTLSSFRPKSVLPYLDFHDVSQRGCMALDLNSRICWSPIRKRRSIKCRIQVKDQRGFIAGWQLESGFTCLACPTDTCKPTLTG